MSDETIEVTRSEERLLVARSRVPYEVVRVRKRIVVEERTITVPVRREELVVERVPVAADAGTTGGVDDVAGGVLELVLSEEQIDVVTRVVPKEIVRITKVAAVGDVAVSAELRAEQVEVERVPGRAEG